MEVTFSADAIDLDKAAHEAARERPGRPIRLRLQPTLLRVNPGDTVGNHRAWQGVSWTLECRTAQEAIEVRRAMQAFFAAVATYGAPAVEKALTPDPATQ